MGNHLLNDQSTIERKRFKQIIKIPKLITFIPHEGFIDGL